MSYSKYIVIFYTFILIICIVFKIYKSGKQIEPFKSDLKFAVMGIFKNESMGIAEWVEHYLWQGADKILLLNNNSTDDWATALSKFDTNKVIVLPAEKAHAQEEHYSKLGLKWLRDNSIDIVAVLDIDEYLFCKDGTNLKTFLINIFGALEHPSSLTCKWSMFGSSGINKQPKSVRSSFTWKKKDLHKNVKSVYFVKDIKDNIGIHTSNVSGINIDVSDRLQLNHYVIQSKEYFEKVKMKRGAADGIEHENIRTWKYFNEYDHADEEDTLLKDML